MSDINGTIEVLKTIEASGQQNINSNTMLISVIVPIYNVEKYVRKCLDSLVNQTLKQIEIICIDDGSTDRSGTIADEYCNTDAEGNGKEWPVIRVIHTKNRGLSAARNRGIDEAQAEWLMFVDSDDWVDERFCEIPWKAAIENKADLVIFGAISEKNGKLKSRKSQKRNIHISEGLIDNQRAQDNGGIVTWNKLYKLELFNSIRYPEGRYFEDVFVTHKIVNVAQSIVYVDCCLYTHVYRKNSISRNHSLMMRKEFFAATKVRYKDLVINGYSKKNATSLLCIGALGLLSTMKECDDKIYVEAEEIVGSIKEMPDSLSCKQKIAFIIWKMDKRLFRMICTVMGYQQ